MNLFKQLNEIAHIDGGLGDDTPVRALISFADGVTLKDFLFDVPSGIRVEFMTAEDGKDVGFCAYMTRRILHSSGPTLIVGCNIDVDNMHPFVHALTASLRVSEKKYIVRDDAENFYSDYFHRVVAVKNIDRKGPGAFLVESFVDPSEYSNVLNRITHISEDYEPNVECSNAPDETKPTRRSRFHRAIKRIIVKFYHKKT